MKRAFIIIVIVVIAMQLIQTEKTNPVTPKELEIKAEPEVMAILKKACYDCHSNEVKWPWYSHVAPFSWTINKHVKHGRAALNFSTWEEYSKEKKQKKLKEIYRTAYASMPLGSYIYFHEEADITRDERSILRAWTGVRK